jgi:uncharacterized protein YkwD
LHATFSATLGRTAATPASVPSQPAIIWQSVGENIAGGQPSVALVMAGWMASPGHCANIMQASFRDIGVACVSAGVSDTYRTYWTMTLGVAS